MRIKTSTFLFILLLPILFMAMSLWITAVSQNPGEDKEFHLLSMEYGVFNPTEPLWGVIAPYFGLWFAGDPFYAAVATTYILFALGMAFNGYTKKSLLIVLFSPALVYLTAQALRQGLAIGFFLVLLAIFHRILGVRSDHRSAKVLFIPTVVTILVHNSIILSSTWIFVAYFLERVKSHKWAIGVQLMIILFCLLLTVLSPVVQLSGTALLIVFGQIVVFIHSLLRRNSSIDNLQISLLLMFCVVGFTLTTTGLRVVFLLGVLMPLTFGNKHAGVQIFLLYFYPLAASYLTNGNSGLFLPAF